MNRLRGFILLFIGVTAFLGIRHWLDRKREQAQDVEIIRSDMDAGDAHLGSWAQKNANALIRFRLRREGGFSYEAIIYAANDTIRYSGRYQIIATPGQHGTYPRLVAVSSEGDTVINQYVYLSRAVKQNVDILNLAKDNSPDAEAMQFYRIQQQ